MENKAETTYYVSNKSSNHSAEQQSVGNHDSGLIGMKKSAEIFDEVSNIENSDKRENIKTDIIHDNERSDASRKDQLINECSESATSTRCDRIFWRNMGEISMSLTDDSNTGQGLLKDDSATESNVGFEFCNMACGNEKKNEDYASVISSSDEDSEISLTQHFNSLRERKLEKMPPRPNITKILPYDIRRYESGIREEDILFDHFGRHDTQQGNRNLTFLVEANRVDFLDCSNSDESCRIIESVIHSLESQNDRDETPARFLVRNRGKSEWVEMDPDEKKARILSFFLGFERDMYDE
eukprot:CAMPEP_0113303734 /NCGR_PEP_ID=MMETSP0010_2-20120614/4028_1 /TAXON_ID=216773 ORGANISM="Corethron hystrix, Strain 308" /NCGR_SAMPLE_ID=MMETSP0010_2 /ASSEMBLY_ACC=CAM_ASM_000155 /LENGTH=296 /DNA_ID=CAMNT_0000157783 /DNA_START=91 /DNA_END=981 /DNA_ORIENTATION=- /assembly_acc=CAM_ASM_000155